MTDSERNIPLGILLILSTIFMALALFDRANQSNNFNQDQKSISKLSSFAVKNNSNVQSDYDKLAAYEPKTDDGDKLKSEKMSQKLDQIKAFRETDSK